MSLSRAHVSRRFAHAALLGCAAAFPDHVRAAPGKAQHSYVERCVADGEASVRSGLADPAEIRALCIQSARLRSLDAGPPATAPSRPSRKIEKTPYLETLDGRLQDNGASAEAAAYLRAHYRDTLENLDTTALERLVDEKVYVGIIPKDKKLTDLPPFTAYRGGKTADGRPCESVRGVNMTIDGITYVMVGEENLVGPGWYAGGHPKGQIFSHEYGHAVYRHGIGLAEASEALAIYGESMHRPQRTGLGDYTDANDREFFAESSAAYLGVGQDYTAEELRWANLKMYGLMRRIYGAPDRYYQARK